MTPASKEVQWDAVKNKRELPLVLLAHGEVMNSPGNPTWDTKGKFGPFANQMFLGDQTLSCIYRIDTQKVNSVEQGVVIPFADKLASGVMRLTFSPDGKELWVSNHISDSVSVIFGFYQLTIKARLKSKEIVTGFAKGSL